MKWLDSRLGEHCLIRIPAESTDGLYSLVEIVSNPGDGTPLHVHEREDEHFFVIDGTLRVSYGDRVFDLHAGDAATLRKGIPHAWGNRSSADVRMVALAVPGGCEQAMELIANGEKPDVFAIAKRFHITPLGPTPF